MTERSLVQLFEADIEILKHLGISTFVETFGHLNTEEDMAVYLDKAFHDAQLQHELAQKESAFFAAKINNEWAGYLKVNWGENLSDEKLKGTFEIERIYVKQAFQNQKIGQMLFDKALELAQNSEYQWLSLGVWENNEKAINFYKKNGFEAFDSHEFVLGKDVQTDILMKLKL